MRKQNEPLSFEKYMPEWAIKYDEALRKSGEWHPSYLCDWWEGSTYSVFDLAQPRERYPLVALGVGLGIIFAITIIDAWHFGGWEIPLTYLVLAVSATLWLIGSDPTSLNDLEKEKKRISLAARYLARSREFDQQRVDRIKLYRDWLAEWNAAQVRELNIKIEKGATLKILYEHKIEKITKNRTAMEVCFFNELLAELALMAAISRKEETL